MPDPGSRKRLGAMHSADLESERQWIEGELERLGALALEGEPVGTVVGLYQADMDAILAEIQRRKRAGTLPRGGTRPTFDRAFVESVKGALDIVELIEASGIILKKAGKEWQGLCPFHADEKSPSLSVSRDKGLWHCFGCGAGGDIVAWVMQKEGLRFVSAVGFLAEHAGIALPERPTQTGAGAAGSDLPGIDVGKGQLRELSDAAWGHLVAANDPPHLFRHGGSLVRFQCDDVPILVGLGPYGLRHETARTSHWHRVSSRADGTLKNGDAHPPMAVVYDMLEYPDLPLPAVDRIVRAPAYAADGRLQLTADYHAAGRIIVWLEPGLEIPDVPGAPSIEDLAVAVATVDDLLHDFPLCVPADRAHAFALFLLPFVRDLIDGPTPMHLAESPAAGTGKGLLVAVMLVAGVGDDVATLPVGRDEEEWRKRITTVLRSGHPVVALDNVDRTLNSSALATVLTAARWHDRLLGGNEEVRIPVRCVWVATGNNPMLSTEIARRCIRIRLDARMDQPWRRDPADFRYQKLLQHALTQRGRLIGAALTLTNAWLAAGRPEAKTPPLGSYESWATVIGGILQIAGVDGFLSNLDELYERADSEGAVWRRFIQGWWDEFEQGIVGVAELYPLAEAMEDFPLGKGKERAQKTMLGMGLKKHLNMVVGDFCIESAGTYRRAARYRLRAAILGNGAPGAPSAITQGPSVGSGPEATQGEIDLDGAEAVRF